MTAAEVDVDLEQTILMWQGLALALTEARSSHRLLLGTERGTIFILDTVK